MKANTAANPAVALQKLGKKLEKAGFHLETVAKNAIGHMRSDSGGDGDALWTQAVPEVIGTELSKERLALIKPSQAHADSAMNLKVR